jgi:hypothetical protein
MGEMYRATDTSLGRLVAIKVLPEAFAQGAERLARFEREARTLAALNHPNIAIIHGLERGAAEGPAEAGHYVRALVIVMIVNSRNLAVRLTSSEQEIISQLPVEVIRSSLAVAGGLVTVPPHGSGLIEASADPKHPMRSNDLPAQARPERCRLAKMNERRLLWLGEPKGGFFDLFPSLGSFRPWPDPSQETFDGSGAVDDRRAAH